MLIGAYPQSVTGNAENNRITANDYASTLNGASGNDTLVASHAAVILPAAAARTHSSSNTSLEPGHITGFHRRHR